MNLFSDPPPLISASRGCCRLNPDEIGTFFPAEITRNDRKRLSFRTKPRELGDEEKSYQNHAICNSLSRWIRLRRDPSLI
jgi:hypothetical protein